ncbi:helix-turn-helix domain-containing protein [Glaciibacter flavus]|uniref:helix-turn-helix domain-containing protein n=1 Tax=Orlajensenia flava TaxID=2565934 RepID=UPI001A9B0E11|nr:helix-turn-helix domain-containing protein [Glaciibacter flavus]
MHSAAAIIRNARAASGLSQTELAIRAKVTQSVISAYESGRRDPSFTMLTKLVDASGARLVIELADASAHPLRDRLTDHRSAVIDALGELGASNVRVFGSVARGEETAASDIDLLVDLDGDVGIFQLAGMRSTASSILGSDVDVVPASSLKPDVAARVLAEATPV